MTKKRTSMYSQLHFFSYPVTSRFKTHSKIPSIVFFSFFLSENFILEFFNFLSIEYVNKSLAPLADGGGI